MLVLVNELSHLDSGLSSWLILAILRARGKAIALCWQWIRSPINLSRVVEDEEYCPRQGD